MATRRGGSTTSSETGDYNESDEHGEREASD